MTVQRSLVCLSLLAACSLPRHQPAPVEPLAMSTVTPPTCTQVQVTVGSDRVMRVMPGTPTIVPGTAVAVIVQRDQRTTTTTLTPSTTTTVTSSTSVGTSTSTTLPATSTLCVPPWGTTSSGYWAAFDNVADGVQCTTGSSASGYDVQACSLAVGSAPVGSQLRCAIYDNQAVLCASAPTPVLANQVNTLAVSGCPRLIPNTAYWVVWNTTSRGVLYGLGPLLCSAPDGVSRYVAASFPGMPNPWGATRMDTCQLSTYLTLVPR